jgi:hypothetical protein
MTTTLLKPTSKTEVNGKYKGYHRQENFQVGEMRHQVNTKYNHVTQVLSVGISLYVHDRVVVDLKDYIRVRVRAYVVDGHIDDHSKLTTMSFITSDAPLQLSGKTLVAVRLGINSKRLRVYPAFSQSCQPQTYPNWPPICSSRLYPCSVWLS